MTPSQLSMVGDKARAFYDKEAKDRQKAAGGDRTSEKGKSASGKLTGTADARDAAGKAVGVSGSLIDRAAKVRKFYDKVAKERQKRKPADSVPVKLPEQNQPAFDGRG